MTGALRPTAPIAADVLLPSDPGLALGLAQELLERPRMANHHHGLWGYSGTAKEGGAELTIQASGIGGPSTAIVVAELAEHGAARLVRVGACHARPAVSAGELVVAGAALARDGASHALGARGAITADAELTASLLEVSGAGSAATVAGADLAGADGVSAEAEVSDLETAALFASAARLGLAAAAILVVGEAPEGRLREAGALAARALARGRPKAVAPAHSSASETASLP